MAVLALRFAWIPGNQIVCCSMASDGHLIRGIHLVELVNAKCRCPPTSKHLLQRQILLFHYLKRDARCQTSCGRGLAGRVYLLLRKVWTYFRNCDFAVEGSPTTHTFIVPRSFMPSCVCFATPPTNCRSMPCLRPMAEHGRRNIVESSRWRIFFGLSCIFGISRRHDVLDAIQPPPADLSCRGRRRPRRRLDRARPPPPRSTPTRRTASCTSFRAYPLPIAHRSRPGPYCLTFLQQRGPFPARANPGIRTTQGQPVATILSFDFRPFHPLQ